MNDGKYIYIYIYMTFVYMYSFIYRLKLCKGVIVGDVSVGKSCLVQRSNLLDIHFIIMMSATFSSLFSCYYSVLIKLHTKIK